MRRLWLDYGKPADPRPGYVAKPYTLLNLREELAALTHNQAFSDDFFDRYVSGRDAIDYARVLAPAGYVIRSYAPDQGWIGDTPVVDTLAGLVVGVRAPNATPEPVQFQTPLYDAGIDEGDVITYIDGRFASMSAWNAIAGKKPGDNVSLVVKRRDGTLASVTAVLKADPRVMILPIEAAGEAVTDAQARFRDSWLGTKVH
jgi:predicted metalloprotease with PDZ domain